MKPVGGRSVVIIYLWSDFCGRVLGGRFFDRVLTERDKEGSGCLFETKMIEDSRP